MLSSCFFWFGCVHLDPLKASLLYSVMQNFPSKSQRLISGDLLDFEIASWGMVVLNYNWFLRVDFLLLLVHRADEQFTHLTLDWFMRLKSLVLAYFKHLLPFLYKQPVLYILYIFKIYIFIYIIKNDTKFEPKVLIFFTTLKHNWEHPESGVGVKKNMLFQTFYFCLYAPLKLSNSVLLLLPW